MNAAADTYLPSGGPRRIAVFRALQLGDMLVAVPALRALRAGFPNAEITLIGLPWAASFASRFSCYVDRFVVFPGFPGIAEAPVDPERTAMFLREQREYGYDLAVQMHGSGRTSNRFVLALGATVTAGYYDPTSAQAAQRLTWAAPYPNDEPEVLRNLVLAGLLGLPHFDSRLEFPLLAADRAEAALLLHRSRHDGPLVGIHAGARPPARRWPAERFATVADYLAARYGATIVLTGAPRDSAAVSAVERAMTIRPLDLCGRTSLGALGAVIAALDLFISNDSGPAHLACAVDTPSVVIFGPADYRRWAPLDQGRHRVARHAVPCSPCPYEVCPIDHRCLRRIDPAAVIAMATELLTKESATCGA